ncbi:hypothetical protein CURTO8I2_170038 [Curtobacterium sp. 8I-2]|nr:hypothetical protein CURTO8I2_170038 [Curtobacterium sp. 8I-2]
MGARRHHVVPAGEARRPDLDGPAPGVRCRDDRDHGGRRHHRGRLGHDVVRRLGRVLARRVLRWRRHRGRWRVRHRGRHDRAVDRRLDPPQAVVVDRRDRLRARDRRHRLGRRRVRERRRQRFRRVVGVRQRLTDTTLPTGHASIDACPVGERVSVPAWRREGGAATGLPSACRSRSRRDHLGVRAHPRRMLGR